VVRLDPPIARVKVPDSLPTQPPQLSRVLVERARPVNDEEMSVEFKRFLIMSAGIATVIGTLVLVGAMDLVDWLHSYDVIVVALPTGAFSLGVLAGSGYGIAGWFLTRLRFTVYMLKTIALSMVVAYGALAVMEYSKNAPDEMGFFEYFDDWTRHSALVTETRFDEPDQTPEPLGMSGYSYRFLELLGLTLGGMGALFIVPAIRKRFLLEHEHRK
jgi:hypothetical protein